VTSITAALHPSSSAAAASWRWLATAAASVALVVAAVLLPTGQAAPVPAAAQGPVPTASPLIAQVAAKDPSRQIGVIVRFLPGADADALVATAGGTIVHRLSIIEGVSARMSAAGAMRIAGEPGVRYVSLDAPVRTSADEGSSTYADTTWAPDTTLTTTTTIARPTGKGVTVAVIDTGIAGDQPDFLGDDGTSRVVASVVLNSAAKTAYDTVGHGTHIAGLIAGNGTRRNDGLRGKYLGAAPDAKLVSVKVSDDEGNTSVGDVINGLQFVVEYKDQLGIRIANLSLNSSVAEPAATDPLDAAAEVAWMNGITVVASAGNRGTAADAVGYAPGNDPFVISVGASDDQDTRGYGDDVMPGWSSIGRTQSGLVKPEVLAPGSRLISVLAPNSLYAAQCPTCIVDGAYLRLGGTSMAAAVASGTVAQILQARPNWTPNQVKGELMDNSRSLTAELGEIRVYKTVADTGLDVANSTATASTLLPSMSSFTSLLDWTRMSLSRMSLSRMSLSTVLPGDPLHASWSRMSLSCACSPVEDTTTTDRVSSSRRNTRCQGRNEGPRCAMLRSVTAVVSPGMSVATFIAS
jgi:serine protease AprX